MKQNYGFLSEEIKINSILLNLQKMKIITIVLALSLVLLSFSAVTNPIEALGTVLPQLNANNISPHRIFNDLMKQSLPLVPYQLTSYGSINRCWSCTLTLIGGLKHQYPSTLATNIWAVAEIPFFIGIDDSLRNQVFNIKFKGNGTIGVYQAGSFNMTWSNGTGGNFTLKLTNQSLFVYIYTTDPANPVNSISILLKSLGSSPPTFTSNILKYLKPFNLLRTCFWQGQNVGNSGLALQSWTGRTLISSATQVSSVGVALEHILQLQKAANATLWLCIPDTADSNYITQMATLIASSRNRSNIMYLQYGNVYTIMNDFPDAKTTPIFDTFMTTYGPTYRNSILFTINYKDIQYYINAMGMRTSPINFTYIDAIGAEPNFGILSVADVWNATNDEIKSNLTHFMLKYETTLNKAYQLAKRNETHLITFSGGPYLKATRYGYIWMNRTNTSYAANATLQLALGTQLYNMNLNDEWVGEYYLQWLGRMKSMGIKSVLFGQLTSLGSPQTNINNDIDFVPLVPYLNMTTPIYRALNQSVFSSRVSTLPISGSLPANPSVCSPSCVWGDCILNACSCYAGYSGNDCSTYTASSLQNQIGVNLQGVSYYNTQNPFIDLHREGSDWVYFIAGQGWNSGLALRNQVPLDSNGYPTYLPPGLSVGTLMARDVLTHYDEGNYTILYDGDGVLTFGMYDVLRVTYGIGKCILNVQPSTNMNNGILVTIQRTNPSNYIRNLRVIRPGFENSWWTQKFSPLLLEKLSPYGTLRFMDWTNTNAQTDVEWSSRVVQSERAYTRNGVAWEDVLHLCNILGKNAWINIPHLATNDYISKLATLFLTKLQPHLTVYVQYSNQVWGTLFPGGQYAEQQGVQYYSNTSRITSLNNATDPAQARFCYLSMKTQNISDVWRSIWSSPSDSARLKIVISPQSVNADTTRRILACENGYKKVDFVAIAPYLSIKLLSNMTVTDVFAGLTTQITKIGQTIQTHLTYTNSYNLSLGCYEAGQGLVGSDTATLKLQYAVQDDTRMTGIYTSYFEMLFNNSIVLANQFTDTGPQSKYGSWGLYEYSDSRPQASKKWAGLKQYISQNNLPVSSYYFGGCSSNCSGNGVCNFGRCSCYSDFKGPNCSIGKYVDFIDCGYLCNFNNGTCVLRNTTGMNRYYGCDCNPGYMGNTCGIPVCASNCSFNGLCVAAEKCSCFRGKMGANCQVDCGCGGHGSCNTDGTCLCDSGFTFNTASKKCQYECLNQASINCYGPNLLSCIGCSQGTCNNGTCHCWPGYEGDNCTTEVTVSYINPNLGINLAGLSYWSTQHLFKDYNKQSSEWIPLYYPNYFNSSIQYTWNTGEYFPIQANGYPASLYQNQSVAKLLLRDLQMRYPQINKTIDYVLLYDGEGIINIGMDAKPYELSAGRIRFTVTPTVVRDNGVYLNLIATNPANPVRNIRVVLAQDEYSFQKDLVTQDFITFVSQFSTIRFMDLMHTNGNTLQEWNQTTRYDMDTQAKSDGISMQLLTELVRRTGRNPWVNVPHKASDDFVTTFANYLYSNVSPKKTIYIEYSNEVWNTFFDQGKYAVAQATALGLSNYHKFYAKRSLQIFNIFNTVFGANSPRLKFVVSFQVVSKWVADQILTGTGLQGVAHIIAGAPYYDCNNIGNLTNTAYFAGLTANDVISRCNSSFSSLDPYLSIENTVASTYNLSIAAYESGTSISQTDTIYSGNTNAAATANFMAANQAPAMYDIYKSLLYRYKSNNYSVNAPMNIFSSVGLPSKYGSWGVLDYMDQINETPTHPKFQAIVDFNQGK